jgi:hypothetical protein
VVLVKNQPALLRLITSKHWRAFSNGRANVRKNCPPSREKMTTRSEIHRRVLEPSAFTSLSFKIYSFARLWLRNRSQPRSSSVLKETIPSRSKQRELIGTDLRTDVILLAVGGCLQLSQSAGPLLGFRRRNWRTSWRMDSRLKT